MCKKSTHDLLLQIQEALACERAHHDLHGGTVINPEPVKVSDLRRAWDALRELGELFNLKADPKSGLIPEKK